MAEQMIEMNKHGYWLIDFLFARFEGNFIRLKQQGNLLSLCREIAGARDILQKFENLKKQHEWNFNL